jgi:hypothetical protein
MDHIRVKQKAQVAIGIRSQPETRIFCHYVRTRWKRQLITTVAFTALTAAALAVHQPQIAICVFTFWVGWALCDYRWFWFLAAEWTTTCALIDWQKAEALAGEVETNA